MHSPLRLSRRPLLTLLAPLFFAPLLLAPRRASADWTVTYQHSGSINPTNYKGQPDPVIPLGRPQLARRLESERPERIPLRCRHHRPLRLQRHDHGCFYLDRLRHPTQQHPIYSVKPGLHD